MKRAVGYAGMILLFVTFLVYLILSRRSYLTFADTQSRLLVEPELQINADHFEKIWKQESKEKISLWGWYRMERSQVLYSKFKRIINTDIIVLCGDSAYPENSIYPLLWNDMEGCILTSSLSWELFGSIDSTGMKLEYEDRTYIVRGVIKAEGNRMYIRHYSKGMGEAIQGVSIFTDKEDTGGSDRVYQLFLNRYNAGDAFMSDIGFYKKAGAFISGIVPFFTALYLAARLIKTTCRNTWSRPVRGLYSAGVILLAMLILWLCGIRLRLTQDMIPSRWSDFSFWSELFTGYGEQLRMLIQKCDVFPYSSYANELFQITKYTGISGILFCACIIYSQRFVSKPPYSFAISFFGSK